MFKTRYLDVKYILVHILSCLYANCLSENPPTGNLVHHQ
uniref:Uncharacterized protein n=1 Tax=Arundo donax TaxID=35708 RepID=A0A0A9GQ96_ARUDO